MLPNVSLCEDEHHVHFNKFWEPLCFKAEEGESTVQLVKVGSPTANDFETSTDGSTWNIYTWDSNSGATITLANAGDKVYFRNTSEETKHLNKDYRNYYKFKLGGRIAASGDITSLLRKSGKVDTIPCGNCYISMFQNCTSLAAAPELPATTLTRSCYHSMFYSCTSLTTAPELPATTLTQQCYTNMFYGCSKLNYIKCLATDISASSCLSNWVNGVSSAGTFVCAEGMTYVYPSDNNGIPQGWTVQEV